jgi:arylsulfatase A-like enzyme
MQDAVLRPAGKMSILRRFEPTGRAEDPGPGSVVVLGCWFGAVVGFTEVGALIFRRCLTGMITFETLHTNWHYAWMIPTSYLALYGALGMLLGVLARVWPKYIGYRESVYLLTFLATLTLALSIPRVHRLALLVLAMGVTSRLSPWLASFGPVLSRLVRVTLPALVVGIGVLIAWQWPEVSEAENRVLASLPAAAVGSPNVLLIVLDTVRADGVAPREEHRDPTPFLTGLMARGIWFDEARSTAPWTLPSHASLFTGRWPHELSVKVGRPLDATHPTVAEHLANHGYATAGFVANTHNANAWYGLDRGFARYQDFYENLTITPIELIRASKLGSIFLMSKLGQRLIRVVMTPPPYLYRKSAAMINRDALSWLDAHGDRPFFVFLNYFDAHDPYEPPPGVPTPYSSLAPRNDARPIGQRSRDFYDDCLSYLDGQIERLFDELGRRGLLENTVVILTADHGEGFGEHDLMGHGVSLYRQELHVPLLVILPSHAGAEQRITAAVSLREIPATIAELTGSQTDSPFPGRSLARFWSTATGPASTGPFLAELDEETRRTADQPHAPNRRGPVTAVVTDGHIFIRNGDGAEELYDLIDDPYETNNQADDPPHDTPLEHFRNTLDCLLRGDEESEPVSLAPHR